MPQPHYNSEGGFYTFCRYSGTPGDVLIFSGTGRLNKVLQHSQMQSGLEITFYDSATATSGGPFPLSGHIVVGKVPPTWPPAVQSGAFIIPLGGEPITIDIPFISGLCVAMKSGQPGFTATWAPENYKDIYN